MRLRTLGCVLLMATLLTLSQVAAEAAGASGSHLKLGASGQVYAWQTGSC